MKYLAFIFIILLNSMAFGQTTPSLPAFITQSVIKGTKGVAYSKTKKNAVHFFAIALSFNAEGKIDTLYYSDKLNLETKKIYALDNSLLKRIQMQNFRFKEYASKIVLFPYFCYKLTDNAIDYESGFLNSLSNLIPEAVYGKPLIVLKPIVDTSMPAEVN